MIIPGLLQTPGYIRQIFAAGYPDGRPDIDQAISARIARREILYDEDRRLEFVITHGFVIFDDRDGGGPVDGGVPALSYLF